MRLSHRTRYWGQYIDAADNDDEVNAELIWCQATRDYARDCCPGFGPRSVHVSESDLSDHHQGWWSLFRVSQRIGDYNSGHRFWKFILVPQGEHGYGKKGCQRRGWSYEGELFTNGNALSKLEDLLDCYFEDSEYREHVHVGIMMDMLYAGKGNS